MNVLKGKKLLVDLLFIYCVFFNLIVMVQLQLFGELIISYTTYKIILLIIDIIYLFAYVRSVYIDKNSVIKYLIYFFPCAGISLVLGIIRFGGAEEPLSVIVNNVMFLFVIASLGFTKSNEKIDFSGYFRVIIVYGIINAILCVLQYISSSLIIPNYTLDGESIYKSVFYYGKFIRSCGLYTSGLEVGILLCFCFFVIMFEDKQRGVRHDISRVLLLVLFLIGIYTTRTRNVYVFFVLLMGISILRRIKLLNSGEGSFKLVFSSIVFSLIVILIGLYWGDDTFTLSTAINFSSKSLLIRLSSWSEWVNAFINKSSFLEILFGSCRTQSTFVVTDNYYMELLGGFGIVGAVLVVVCLIQCLNKAISSNIQYKNYIISFLSSFFGFSILNLPITFFMIYLPLIILLVGKEENDEKNLKSV